MKTEEIEKVMVTPAMAQELLKRNNCNRRLRQSYVDLYAKMMANGEWKDYHPDPICFDKYEQLVSGQHRLLGVVKSGKSIGFYIKINVSDEILPYLDCGLKRTMEDRLHFFGEKIEKKTISIVQFLQTYPLVAKRCDTTPELFFQYYMANKKALDYISRVYSHDSGLGASSYWAAFYQYLLIDESEAVLFIDDFKNVNGSRQNARVLRDYALRHSRMIFSSIGKVDSYKKAVSACVNHIENKNISKLYGCMWPRRYAKLLGDKFCTKI